MFRKRLIDYVNNKYFYYFNKNKFAYLAKNSLIQCLLRLEGRENISIAENVIIQRLTWLAAVPLTGESSCKLSIGKGTVVGHFNHIYATKEISIGENVLIADKVYIADNQHGFERIDLPIKDQPIKQLQSVKIGDGTWIGENVCIIGAHIGKNCIIGANSVVNKSIPDYCVVVGAPARIIKKYNFTSEKWEKV